MAKFHNYYVLCPLIDQKSFLGVGVDKEKEYVIVTLGRNVVNKYRLSDQKQVGGWTSKDHITSPVIYDKQEQNYVGVFNKNTIKTWKDDSANLDKIKKFKFPLNILKLLPRQDQSPLIIFANGNCASLPYALDNRKTYESKSMIKDNETIVDVVCYSVNKTDHVCYVSKNNSGVYEIIDCPVRDELGDLERSKLRKTKITRSDDTYVVGQLIEPGKLAVYVLWSDAKMTVFDLMDNSWKTIGTVPWISTVSSVSMAWMGKNHVILFGSNVDQDGAIIVGYNIILGVGSCRYPMKMYTENAKFYCHSSKIILEASNHIGILPYVLETTRNLSSLLGSHEVVPNEAIEVANWGAPTPTTQMPSEIKKLLGKGITERSICVQVLTPLIEKHNLKRIITLLNEFKDIPESVLVLLVNMILKLLGTEKADLLDSEKFTEFCKNSKSNKFVLLRQLLLITFSDALMIPHLRNGLSLDQALFLMRYISHLLLDPNTNMSAENESKLYDWCILIMDAFYQQYLMTKDEKVTFVLRHSIITSTNLIHQLEAVNNVMPLLNQILSGKLVEKNEDTLSYSIELMQI